MRLRLPSKRRGDGRLEWPRQSILKPVSDWLLYENAPELRSSPGLMDQRPESCDQSARQTEQEDRKVVNAYNNNNVFF